VASLVDMIRHRFTAAALLSTCALAGLTGCGSKGESPSATATANAQDSQVSFAQCLRQHGINAPDPQPGSGLRIEEGDQGKLDAALKACKQYNPKTDAGRNDPAAHDRAVKMAQCLRRHGLKVPDPQPGQPLDIGAGQPGKRAGGHEVNAVDQTKVQRAQDACRKEVPAPAGSGG
jgi:predicted small lipoprotein YifL